MATKKWTIEEEVIVADNLDRSDKEIVSLLKSQNFIRTARAVKDKKSDIQSKFSPFSAERLQDVYYINLLIEKELEYINKTTKKENKKIQLSSSSETAFIHLSDVHIGEVIRNIKGEVVVDTRTTVNRLRSIGPNLEGLFDKHICKSVEIEEVILGLSGDLVDGENIYAHQAFQIDMPVIQQVQAAVAVFYDLACHLSEKFPSVRIEGVPGNHGRSSRRHEPVSPLSNWDNAIFMQLDCMFKANTKIKNVQVNYSMGNYHMVDVRGHKGMMRHEAIKGDVAPSERAKLGAWYKEHKMDFVTCGHYHHPGLLYWENIPIIRNGSVTGKNEYAEQIARFSDPAQMIFGISEKRVPTWIYILDFKS